MSAVQRHSRRGFALMGLAAIVSAAALLSDAGLSVRAAGQAATTPTFNAQIAPILNANCVTCHRPEGVAPFSLSTYEDARQRAGLLKAVTRARLMPPWYADPQYGQFKNARGLSDAQIDLIAAWADAQAPEGVGTPPQPPKFQADGWMLDRPPDQIIELPFGELDVPAQGEVPTFTVWLKPFREEKMVQAIQVRPSIPGVVHHSSLSLGPLPPGTHIGRAQAFAGGPVLDGIAVLNDGRPWTLGGEQITDKPVMFYVPGGGQIRFDDGLAKRFGRDEYLSWGLHLMSRGKQEKLRVQVGLWFARRYPRREARLWTLTEQLSFDGQDIPVDSRGVRNFPSIAPGAQVEMIGSRRMPRDVTLYALWPHMHYRGKDMTFVLTEPNGKQTTILRVPSYNPHWQLTYELAKPLKLKRGSVLTAYGHYDNSRANLHNPDPTATVKFGPQGTDEMYLPFIEVSLDDEDLRLEQFTLPK